MNPQAKLLSIGDASVLLSISADSVRRLIRRGQLAHVRLLKRVMIPRSAIDRMCTPQTEPANVRTTGQPPKEKSSS